MTREDWMHDLRAVDEVVIEAGEKMQNDGKLRRFWWIIYSLAVPVWHLLNDKIRGLDNDNRNG